MRTFDEWFDSEYPSLSKNLDNYFCKTTREYSNAAWIYQQEKIESLRNSNNELQKREDKAERKLQLVQECINKGFMTSRGYVIHVSDLEQALKGDQNRGKQPSKHIENIAIKGFEGGDQ